jgi:Flp pilus assembly protein TadD
MDDLNEALELNPRFAEAWQLRGEVHLALGETDVGRADLQHAADLDPRLSQDLDRTDDVR